MGGAQERRSCVVVLIVLTASWGSHSPSSQWVIWEGWQVSYLLSPVTWHQGRRGLLCIQDQERSPKAGAHAVTSKSGVPVQQHCGKTEALEAQGQISARPQTQAAALEGGGLGPACTVLVLRPSSVPSQHPLQAEPLLSSGVHSPGSGSLHSWLTLPTTTSRASQCVFTRPLTPHPPHPPPRTTAVPNSVHRPALVRSLRLGASAVAHRPVSSPTSATRSVYGRHGAGSRLYRGQEAVT